VFAVVVTFNRLALLKKCLEALLNQEGPPDRILVIDNASEDGTSVWLAGYVVACPAVGVVSMKENLGGAGGFAEGLKQACAQGAEWMWMMDDDAEPHPNALKELLLVAKDPNNIYGSVAVCGQDLSWITTILEPVRRTVEIVGELPQLSEVESLPFLGFLAHRQIISRIGYPDVGFFIAADDVEYCHRAKRAGAKIFIAGNSLIEHPKSSRYTVRLLGFNIVFLRLPPWKRYYDTRNRIFIAQEYFGMRLFTQTVPSIVLRTIAAALNEPHPIAQIKASVAGIVDAFLYRKGRRHQKWSI
jgi:GT2 family glycosyltransferase